MKEIIRDGLAELGLLDQVPPEAPEQLAEYGRLMLEKNQVMNLTAITDPEQAARLHMLDSAALLLCADFQGGKTLIDVGTGAGFPGLPLAMACPGLRVTLLDAQQKRLNFLEAVVRELGLTNVTLCHSRAEDGARNPALRERFNVAVARAVAALPVLCELCLPLVRPGGKFLAMKSVESDQELASAGHAIATLGGAVAAVRDYVIPGTQVRHRLIIVEKAKKTPEKYPRMFAKIKKNPL